MEKSSPTQALPDATNAESRKDAKATESKEPRLQTHFERSTLHSYNQLSLGTDKGLSNGQAEGLLSGELSRRKHIIDTLLVCWFYDTGAGFQSRGMKN